MDKWKGPFSTADKKQMTLSEITQNGMKITSKFIISMVHTLFTCFYTLNLFLELIPILLKLPGVTCFLTEKLSQDPL